MTAFDDGATPSNGAPHNPPTGFALAALEAFFDPMFRFGHPRQFPQWRLGDSVGQIIIHLHHLLVARSR